MARGLIILASGDGACLRFGDRVLPVRLLIDLDRAAHEANIDLGVRGDDDGAHPMNESSVVGPVVGCAASHEVRRWRWVSADGRPGSPNPCGICS